VRGNYLNLVTYVWLLEVAASPASSQGAVLSLHYVTKNMLHVEQEYR